MEMERTLLIVGRVDNNLSVRNSRFGHRTLQAIIVGSRQMVALLTPVSGRGGFRKGPTTVTTTAYPKRNHGIQGSRRITRCLYTTSTIPVTTIARLSQPAHKNTIALCTTTEQRTHEGETRTHSGNRYIYKDHGRTLV
jgi:hypothetical protein